MSDPVSKHSESADARPSHRGRPIFSRLICVTAVLLSLIIAGLAAGANSGGLTPDTRVITFSSGSGQWVLTTFAQVKPGSEFYFNNQLYRAADSDKPQVVLSADAGRLAEADLPLDKTSRRPEVGDVVQVLGKDLRFVAHAMLSAVPTGETIRFQGIAYTVAADRSLVETRTVFRAATTTLQRIEITKSAWQHIRDGHTVGGTENAGKSIFNPGENIQALIKNAELLTPVPEANGNLKRDFDAGRNIGMDGLGGRQTSTYRVITTQSGKLVTAYPIVPKG